MFDIAVSWMYFIPLYENSQRRITLNSQVASLPLDSAGGGGQGEARGMLRDWL